MAQGKADRKKGEKRRWKWNCSAEVYRDRCTRTWLKETGCT